MDSAADSAKLVAYAQDKLFPILNPILERLFEARPANAIQFMLEQLREVRGQDDEVTMAGPKKRLPRMTVEGGNNAWAIKTAGKGSRRRAGVSAETVDVKALASQPTRVIEKNEEDIRNIRDSVATNFLFTSLDADQMKTVVDAMMKLEFQPGDYIIKQGDNGDDFYCLEQGDAECYVDFGNGEPPKMVKDYTPGESFGELSLMYNTPRAASIVAKTVCCLWAMDRTTFQKVLLTSTAAKRTKYEEFLEKVPLLATLDHYERGTIADVLDEQAFDNGDSITREGDPGDQFYILIEGKAKAMKRFGADDQLIEVKQYTSGDFFGELALINNKPRAASVVAVGAVTVVRMDKSSFTRLMGPVEEILFREKVAYERVVAVARMSIVQGQSLSGKALTRASVLASQMAIAEGDANADERELEQDEEQKVEPVAK